MGRVFTVTHEFELILGFGSLENHGYIDRGLKAKAILELMFPSLWYLVWKTSSERKTSAGKANFTCFVTTFLADMIIMGAFYGVAGAGTGTNMNLQFQSYKFDDWSLMYRWKGYRFSLANSSEQLGSVILVGIGLDMKSFSFRVIPSCHIFWRCLFFAYGVNQVSILNRVDWKKVDFYSSIVNSVILAVCSLSMFILSMKWKDETGYGSLGLENHKRPWSNSLVWTSYVVTSGSLTTVATLSKLFYIKSYSSDYKSDEFDTV